MPQSPRLLEFRSTIAAGDDDKPANAALDVAVDFNSLGMQLKTSRTVRIESGTIAGSAIHVMLFGDCSDK